MSSFTEQAKINHYNAIVIGGGFYGCNIAAYLSQKRGLKKVLVIEKEDRILKRASYNNQARVHNGYHYPRSFTTAFRSRINFPKFVLDWPEAIKTDFTKVYAVAKNNSKVTANQFYTFCNQIGAEVNTASDKIKFLFNPRLIEDVFIVKEYAFDTRKLATWAEEALNALSIEIRFNITASLISKTNKGITLKLKYQDLSEENISCDYVFNCSYSGLNQLGGDFSGTKSSLKHEITEMALIDPPAELADLGITVMDGSFFSIMPFPARGLCSVSHVRYTPHYSWIDDRLINPYQELDNYPKETRQDRMIRDISRFLPCISKSTYVDSLFEIKTVLLKNETDDGRPILYEKSIEIPGLYSVLGGKIDNIYDVIKKLDLENINS